MVMRGISPCVGSVGGARFIASVRSSDVAFSDATLSRSGGELTRRGLGFRVLDRAQIDRGYFVYYKKRLRKDFLTNGPSVKCYSYVKLEILATFNY